MITILNDLEERIKSVPLEIFGQFPESLCLNYRGNETYGVTYMGCNPKIIPDCDTAQIGYISGTTSNPRKILMDFISFVPEEVLDLRLFDNSQEIEFDG